MRAPLFVLLHYRISKATLALSIVAVLTVAGSLLGRGVEGSSAARPTELLGAGVSATQVAAHWPNSTTTGVPDGFRLRASGPLHIKEAGTVIDGLDVQGCLTVDAADVTIRRSRIRCENAETAVLTLMAGSQGTRLSEIEVDGAGSSAIGISGGGFALSRADVHGVSLGVLAGNRSTVEDSWVHGLTSRGKPVQAVEVQGGSEIKVRGNYLQVHDARHVAGNALLVNPDQVPVQNVDATDNLFDGGDVSVQGSVEGLEVEQNVFTRRYTQAALQVSTVVKVSDNRYIDGEAVVPVIATATIGAPMAPLSRSPAVSAPPSPAPSSDAAGSSDTVPTSWPGAASTGVSDRVTLKSSGSMTIDKAGSIVQNLDIRGCLTISADNVVVRNSRISCAAGSGNVVTLQSGVTGVLLDQVEIDGKGSADICVAHGGYTLRRSEVHNCVDGARAGSNTVIEDSWVHHLVRTNGSHNDAVQTVTGSNIVIRDNRLDAFNPDTDDPMNASYIFGPSIGPVRGVTVTGNYMNGGNYTINGGAEDVVIRNNTFGRDYRYGPMRVVGSFSASGNQYLGGGAVSNDS